MTVIAWDGRYVAADSYTESHNVKHMVYEPKLTVRGSVIFATVGWAGLKHAWIDWLDAGADPKDTPVHGASDNDIGCFIVFENGKCWVYSKLVPYPVEERAPYAFGTGEDFAIGAMMADASAERAAEIAAEISVGCGGPIQVIDLHSLREEAS